MDELVELERVDRACVIAGESLAQALEQELELGLVVRGDRLAVRFALLSAATRRGRHRVRR
jgi:hypothetical protein